MNTAVTAVLSGVLGLATGSVSTYFIMKRSIELKYAILLDEEVAAVKDYYRLVRKDGVDLGLAGEDNDSDDEDDDDGFEEEDISEERVTAEKIIETQNYASMSKPQPPTKKNVFDLDESSKVKPEEEIFPEKYEQLPDRDPDAPYIIGLDTWTIGTLDNTEYEKEQLTYYEGDDTLTDSEGNIVHDVASVVGIKNLNRFGMGSDSPDLVYIRNEQMEKDFEVFRDDAEYTTKVLGLPSQYVSPTTSKIRKMRDND